MNTAAQGLPRYSWNAMPVRVEPGAREPVPRAATANAARDTAVESRAGVVNSPGANESHMVSTTAREATSPASFPPIPSATK